MKKIIVFITVLTTMFWSCSDDLDFKPRNELTLETFFASEGDALAAINGVYLYFNGNHTINKGVHWYFARRAGQMSDDANGDAASFTNGNLGAGDNIVEGIWTDAYRTIRLSNIVIENIDRPDMDETLRDRIRAEATFFRAFSYYLLAFNYGDVPYIDKALTIDEVKVGKTPKATVIANILADLEAAATDLPISYGASDTGRITKGAALGLKAKVLLYNENYTEAATEAKRVIDLGVYNLFDDGVGTGYQTVHHQANENNEEVIFDFQFAIDGGANGENGHFNQVWINPPGVSGGWGSYKATQALVDEFEDNTGLPITDVASVYDPLNPFDNRDPRLDLAIAREGEVFTGAAGGTVVTNMDNTGYYQEKRIQPDFNGGFGVRPFNIIYMRYAEILLTYAEAKIESGSIDQTVLDAINDVRARGYGTVRSDVANYPEVTTNSQSELRAIVRRERRVELCFEGDMRLMDIRRWEIAPTVLNGPVMGVNGRTLETRVFEAPKHYVWPIPQKEIDRVGADLLPQNTGY